MKRILRGLTLILLLAIVIGAGYGYSEYRRWQEEALPIEQETIITVGPGTPLSVLATDLARRGLLHHARDLKWLALLRGDAEQIKAGEYRLQAGITTAGLLDKLVTGQVIQHAITIIEGTTFADLMRQVRAHRALRQTLPADAGPAQIAEAVGIDGNPEGRFLPETYRFPRGTTDVEFLRRAHEALQSYLDKAWAQRAADLPYDSPYEALIMASIVEKETAVEEERFRIAGVFVRRLQKGMRLQTDPTVIYGLGEDFDGNLTRRHLTTDTAYNTYTRGGLPPTPICLPGRAAIEAALQPAEGEALYFVATGDGRHAFARTLEEHNRNVRRYQLNGSD